MMRFMPDTVREALWRPVAMGAPDAGVYVEIMAPDVRFACLLLLTLVALAFAVRRDVRFSPTWVLLTFVWLTFIPWMATTSNGRYFIAVLLLVGPLSIALIHQLPLTRTLRLTLAGILLGLQSFVIVQSTPWGSWGLVQWTRPYFELALSAQERNQPATYVTISSISYSLVAPQFNHQSRWINLASLHGDPARYIDDQRAQDFFRKTLKDGRPLMLLVPTLPAYMDALKQPDARIRAEINRMLALHQLELSSSAECKVLPSRSIALMALRNVDNTQPAVLRKLGFWVCPLAFPVPRPLEIPKTAASAHADEVFATLERACPRMFRSGEAANVRVADGFSRTYLSSDIRAYVLDSGEVLYKYWRGLNPGRLGKTSEVLAEGFTMNCNSIRGRSGLPWEREL